MSIVFTIALHPAGVSIKAAMQCQHSFQTPYRTAGHDAHEQPVASDEMRFRLEEIRRSTCSATTSHKHAGQALARTERHVC